MDTIRIVLENLGKTFIDQKIGRIAIEDFFYDDKDFMTDGLSFRWYSNG